MVHLAGNAVVIGDRVIQRCLLCGYKLLDNLNCAMPQNADGSTPTFAEWQTGSLVYVGGCNPQESHLVGQTEHPVFNKAWEDCCLGENV